VRVESPFREINDDEEEKGVNAVGRIHFIGGEKGGVGKSVVARLLSQYCVDRAIRWIGFDTDRSHGALVRYYGDYSNPIEITRFEQLDRIIEAAEEGYEEVIVDLAAQTESGLEAWFESGEIVSFVEQMGHSIYFWYVVDDGKDSVDLLGRMVDRLDPRCRLIAVRNFGRGEDFMLFDAADLGKRIEARGGVVLDLPRLHALSMLKIDAYDKSFWAAVYNNDPSKGTCLSLMERQRVHVFVRKAHALIRSVLNGD
jgi:hypothetical protein